MKENPYDNSVFFAKYGEMLRSKKGLNGAGEWREFQKLLPGFAGKRVLDLGCGYGWHCSYAAEHGAVTVLGTDISEKMIRTAIRKNSHPQITYHLAAMEDLDFADASFDVILSSLALHYIEDYESLIQKISTWLVKDGQFVFSVEHPVFTAYGNQDWYYGADGEILHFPVDHYYYEGKRDAAFFRRARHQISSHTDYLSPDPAPKRLFDSGRDRADAAGRHDGSAGYERRDASPYDASYLSTKTG